MGMGVAKVALNHGVTTWGFDASPEARQAFAAAGGNAAAGLDLPGPKTEGQA
jgi:3-hydroxyisobutyrate dehydrogenase-like beta-hydroxyacid dehydrogenase